MDQDKNKSNALVVGAGISGIRSALDLAQQNYKVTLIDKSPAIGGLLTQLDNQFPSNHCGMCKMLPLVNRDESSQFCLRKGLFHENINLMLSCELSELTGEAGNFTARLRQQPTWVDPDLCVGCGLCENVCPREIPDCFNEGLSSRKAIYLPVPHSIPNPYVIDLAICTRCGACEEICPTNAILLSQSNRTEFNILVVDDELSLRDSLKEWLEEEDFSVDMAASGKDAIDKLSQKTYQLMLTDIKMPQMSGVELLKKAKAVQPNLSVVMMTAYATVETAVEAMKIGAIDYLVKPFDPDTLVPMVIRIFQDIEATKDFELTTDTIILSIGTTFYDPADKKNVFGYGIFPNVVTNIEFERLMSPIGPNNGALLRLDNKQPAKKIAWLQCVGSRDTQKNADFCSNICCMMAIKEAILTKEISDNKIDTTIFYMDIRATEKTFQRYYDSAQNDHHVNFERCKIHSLSLDKKTNDLSIRYISMNGELKEELYDMVVLSTGQRPGYKTAKLAKICKLPVNPWGFLQTEPFSLTHTEQKGIFTSGSTTGLKDISQSLIQASAAAQSAGCIIHSKGSKTDNPSENKDKAGNPTYRDVSREPADLLMIICSCKERLYKFIDPDKLSANFIHDPSITNIFFMDSLCTDTAWQELEQLIMENKPNRVLIGACHPYLYIRKIKELAKNISLAPEFIEIVDIMTNVFKEDLNSKNNNHQNRNSLISHSITGILNSGANSLKLDQYQISNDMQEEAQVIDSALVIGGGIAGMTAALGIADQGHEVALIEKSDLLGGNLNWLSQTIDKLSCKALLKETVAMVKKQPLIKVFLKSQVLSITGQAPKFQTIIENDEKLPVTIGHGTVIIATGGDEAKTQSFNYNDTNSKKNLIVTQKELEIKLADNAIDPEKLDSIVMIQCVDSREEPRNYCSKVCCPTALKQAQYLKEKNPEADIYFLYRDMMTCGFIETYFTKARKEGIIFISYETDNPPQLKESENKILINAFEPVLSMPIEIDADMVVLATGITPRLPDFLPSLLNTAWDIDGFFKEADSKWRPIDSIEEGIYACGIALSPASIPESIASAKAAAQRALSIISRPTLKTAKTVARVRHSLCSLCHQCINACPYGARMLNPDETKVMVNETMCQGCGACAAVCPNNASVLQGYTGQQMMGVIDSVFENMLD
jgi:heterodisulfide reductase subunit A2